MGIDFKTDPSQQARTYLFSLQLKNKSCQHFLNFNLYIFLPFVGFMANITPFLQNPLLNIAIPLFMAGFGRK